MINAMKGKQILVVGETIIDEYVHCDPLGMSSDSATVVVRPSETDLFLGGAGIVAQHVASMGAKPIFFSVVGQDVHADFARAELERRDIDYRLVVGRVSADDSQETLPVRRQEAPERQLVSRPGHRRKDRSSTVRCDHLA